MRCPPVRIDQSAWKFRATLQIALNGVFHPPASSWCWQRASVLHRAGSLPSLSVPAYHWSLFSEEGRGEYRGFGVRRGGGTHGIGWLTSHLRRSARGLRPFKASKQRQEAPTRAAAKRFIFFWSDQNPLPRVCQLVNGTAKLAQSPVYELVPECGPAAAASVFSGEDPHTKKKEWKKERRGERRPLCPGAYLMESNLLTSLGWAPWNKLPDVVFFPFSHFFRSAFHNSLPQCCPR